MRAVFRDREYMALTQKTHQVLDHRNDLVGVHERREKANVNHVECPYLLLWERSESVMDLEIDLRWHKILWWELCR